MNKYKWIIKEPISEEIQARFPQVLPIILQLLWGRGLRSQEQIDEFLYPDYSQDLHDPWLFSQMDVAVKRIEAAKAKNEKVVIYGDYDADGVCGSVILSKTFQKLGLPSAVYLPDREKEGYGLNPAAIKKLAENGVKLIITVDCGISNAEEVDLAKAAGLEVIITDHHHLPAKLPAALAIIHPLADKNYPFKHLAGGGVAFKFAQALISYPSFAIPDAASFKKWLLDLVAISTVADMVPLIGENRTLVKHGLIVLSKTKNLGLKKLMETAMINPEKIDTYTIGFQIAPRINAAGRMDHANTAYELLITENIEEAITIAYELNRKNSERQALTDKLVAEAKKQLGEITAELPVLFAWGEKWNAGVIGLVASKLTQEFARPAVALSFDGQTFVASGRSIEEFNLIEALDHFKDYFIKYGGHAGAAGFSVARENFEEFKGKFLAYARDRLKGAAFVPKVFIDQQISLPTVGWPLLEMLEQFQPYGQGNARPRFLIRGLKVVLAEAIGRDSSHLRLMVEQNGQQRKIICFGFGDLCDRLASGEMIEAVVELGVNEWNGNREIQLSLIDIKKI